MVINAGTRVLGILGSPLGHSLSPLMHNCALQRQGLDYVYVAFPVGRERLAEAIAALRVLEVAGVNVTIPFKEEILPYLDDLSDEARVCGAVNVVKNTQGRMVGYNTDGPGFMAYLREAGVEVAGRKVVLLGAGGAARAIAYCLAREGSHGITIVNRTVNKARHLADAIVRETGVETRAMGWEAPDVMEMVQQASMVVNATSIGMHPYSEAMPPLHPAQFHDETVVCDVVYNPMQTRWLLEAQRRGLKTIDGVGMFVHQGVLAFERFTGVPAPIRLMREVVVHELAENQG